MVRKNLFRKAISILAAIVICTSIIGHIRIEAAAETLQHDLTGIRTNFEDGKVQGWSVNGGLPAKGEVVTEEAYEGKHSFTISRRSKPSQTPTYDLRFAAKKGQTYRAEVWVKYMEGPENRRFSLTFYKKDGNGEDYRQPKEAAGVTVPKGRWTKLEGSYTLDFTGALDVFNCYVKLADEISNEALVATSNYFIDYYIDNAVINVLSDELPSGKLILDSGFEDGTLQGWSKSSSNSAKLMAATDVKYSGDYSLKVTGRKNSDSNPAFNLKAKAQKGCTYEISAWVFYNSGPDTKRFSLTFYKNDGGRKGKKQAEGANQIEVRKGEWTKLTGRYRLDYDTELEEFSCFVEAVDTGGEKDTLLDAFYVDDAVITVPDNWTQPSEAVITNDFEDVSAQGWYTDGRAKLEPKIEQAHGGVYALKISGRKEFTDLPKFNLAGKLKKGNTYRFSAWVKFTGDGQGHRLLNLSVYQKDSNGKSILQLDDANLVTAYNNVWTKLEGSFNFNYDGKLQSCYLYVEIADENKDIEEAYRRNIPLVNFYIDDVSIVDENGGVPTEIESDIPSLHSSFSIPVGTVVETYLINQGDVHANLLLKHFNSLSVENSMLLNNIHPKEKEYNFTPAERLVEFAINNKMKVRGHALLSHEDIPDWMFVDEQGIKVTREVLLSRLKEHISTVIGYFKNKYGDKNPIYCWDVVDEALDDSGKIKNTPWMEIIGPDYIEKAFEFAREADPNTKLFINGSDLENTEKGNALYNIVKDLKDRNVPVDGLGYNVHTNMHTSKVESIKSVIESFSTLGVRVEITQLDMSIYNSASEEQLDLNPELLLDQAVRYKELSDMFREEAGKGNLTGITFSGAADDNTWLDIWPVPGRKDAPLLFGKDLKAKPAYWALVDAKKLQEYIVEVEKLKAASVSAVKIEEKNSIPVGNSEISDRLKLHFKPAN